MNKAILKLFVLLCVCSFVGCDDSTSSSPEPVDFATLCPASARGTFIDERDSNEYAYTTIGDQVWMAENLKYNLKHSVCYDSLSANCDTYGRFYVFESLEFNLLGRITEMEFFWDSVYTLCPRGWRVAKADDFKHLREQVQADAKSLISTSDGGNDLCGFNLKLAGKYGYKDGERQFYGKGRLASLWTQTRSDVDAAYTQTIDDREEIPDLYADYGNILSSSWVNYMGNIRCVKE